MSERLEILLVTCSLEESRAQALELVVDNINKMLPNLKKRICVLDNASTVPGTAVLLKKNFNDVFCTSKNVGYWSAVDWWLHSMSLQPPKYVYVIESDMIHYGYPELALEHCVDFLDLNTDVGGVRLHEYSVEHRHLYNKDAPVKGSKKNVWQSHTNRVTGEPVKIALSDTGIIHRTNFLTQLPAVNRFETMFSVFARLLSMRTFSEPDFQRFYHESYKCIGVLDGGIYHHDPGCVNSSAITASWSDPRLLQQIGYHGTRTASITPRDEYNVTRL